jgi:hypothetical protein
MKVWVITWFSAEQYTEYTGVDSVHASEAAALAYIQEQGAQPLGVDLDKELGGYFLYEPEMFEVTT